MSSDSLVGLPDIYVHRSGGDCTETWHVIKLSSLWRSKRRVRDEFLEEKLPPLPIDDLSGFASAAIGSHIYVSGGNRFPCGTFRLYPPVNNVYRIDTHDPNPKWEEAPPMNSDRFCHYAFADQGKMYVIAGHNILGAPVDQDGTQLYAEVYDPTSGEGWKELARAKPEDRLPQDTVSGHAIVDHGYGKKILFHSFLRDELYGTLVGSNRIFVYDYGFCPSISASACVDGILYYLDSRRSMQELYAYDTDKPGSTHKPVSFSKMRTNFLPYRPLGEPSPTSCLLSLGKRIRAVIWGQDCYSEDIPSLRAHCSILEMSKVNDSFYAKVLNYSNYLMRPGRLACCLAMRPPQEDVEMDGKFGQINESPIKSKHKRKKEKKKNRGTKKRKTDHNFLHGCPGASLIGGHCKGCCIGRQK